MGDLTKAEQRWRWLGWRIWQGTFTGWTPIAGRVTKADRAMIERRVKIGHVERDEYDMYRLTDAGRAALSDTHNARTAEPPHE